MNPAYGIFAWMIIGGLAGWVGSMIMRVNARMGLITNIAVGIVGGVLGGYITRTFFGDRLGNNGLVASFAVALLGACIVIGLLKLVAGRGR
ncbi:MAG: GlsB/YeaQ/YmgE family stress response membrane protein [Archangium sp.]|nr:GlsB/YeaQ/YmgE family stress response membrane protein [Archangium sp.]